MRMIQKTAALIFVGIFILLAAQSLSVSHVFAESVGDPQCADTKAKCNKQKNNGGGAGTPAASTPAQESACSSFGQLNSGISCDQGQNGSAGQSAIGKIAGNIVNVLSIVAGMAAVVLIIYGGFRYITSGGDSNAVGSAKSALVYALIGIAIAALAQVLVHVVLSATNT